jgi:hypothetical protein
MLYSRPSQSDPLAVVMGSGSVGGAEPAGRWPPPRWGTDVAPSPTHLDRVSKPVQGVAGSDPPHGLGARCRRRRGRLRRAPAPESTGSHQKVDATRDPSLDNISPRLAPPLLVGLVIVAELTHDQSPRPARIRHVVVVDDSQDNVSPSGRTLQVWQRGPVPTSSAPITPQPRGNGEAVRSRAGITALRNVGRPPAWAGRAPVVGCQAVRPRSGR